MSNTPCSKINLANVRRAAERHQWIEEFINETHNVVSFTRHHDRINVYYSSGTICINLKHHIRGRTQLMCPCAKLTLLARVFSDPRFHLTQSYIELFASHKVFQRWVDTDVKDVILEERTAIESYVNAWDMERIQIQRHREHLISRLQSIYSEEKNNRAQAAARDREEAQRKAKEEEEKQRAEEAATKKAEEVGRKRIAHESNRNPAELKRLKAAKKGEGHGRSGMKSGGNQSGQIAIVDLTASEPQRSNVTESNQGGQGISKAAKKRYKKRASKNQETKKQETEKQETKKQETKKQEIKKKKAKKKKAKKRKANQTVPA